MIKAIVVISRSKVVLNGMGIRELFGIRKLFHFDLSGDYTGIKTYQTV